RPGGGGRDRARPERGWGRRQTRRRRAGRRDGSPTSREMSAAAWATWRQGRRKRRPCAHPPRWEHSAHSPPSASGGTVRGPVGPKRGVPLSLGGGKRVVGGRGVPLSGARVEPRLIIRPRHLPRGIFYWARAGDFAKVAPPLLQRHLRREFPPQEDCLAVK